MITTFQAVYREVDDEWTAESFGPRRSTKNEAEEDLRLVLEGHWTGGVPVQHGHCSYGCSAQIKEATRGRLLKGGDPSIEGSRQTPTY